MESQAPTSAVSGLWLYLLVPSAIPLFRKTPSKLRHAWNLSFSRPYALAISVSAELFHNAPRFSPAQEEQMEEINSILYDMHGTAHVILIAALFVILLIVR